MRGLMGVVLSATLISVGAQAGTRVVEQKDLFRMQWVTDPQIRKDGAQIAYGRMANDIMTDRQSQSLWLIDTATGAQTPLASGPGFYSSPRWSPDGSRIAYLSAGADGRTQIMIHWLRGGESASITSLVEAPSDITWSPDGKQIAFVMLQPEAAPAIGKQLAKPPGAQWGAKPRVIDTMSFRADGQGFDKPGFRHIYVMSVDGGTPRQLTSGPFSDAGPLAWSPDGKSIFFAGNRNKDWRNPGSGIFT